MRTLFISLICLIGLTAGAAQQHITLVAPSSSQNDTAYVALGKSETNFTYLFRVLTNAVTGAAGTGITIETNFNGTNIVLTFSASPGGIASNAIAMLSGFGTNTTLRGTANLYGTLNTPSGVQIRTNATGLLFYDPSADENVIEINTGALIFNAGFKDPRNAAVGRLMTSDASGNGAWSAPPTNGFVAGIDVTNRIFVGISGGTLTTNRVGNTVSYDLVVTPGGGSGESNYLATAGATNTSHYAWPAGKTGVTNLIRSISVSGGLAMTDEGTNILLTISQMFGETNYLASAGATNTTRFALPAGKAANTNLVRTISVGGALTMTDEGTNLAFSVAANSGEANTLTGQGTSWNIINPKSGVDLRIKGFIPGANMSISTNSTDLTYGITNSPQFTGTLQAGTFFTTNLATFFTNLAVGGTNLSGYFRSTNFAGSRALTTDANGTVAESAVTATELGYNSGTTGNLQTQLDAKAATISGEGTEANLPNVKVGTDLRLKGLKTGTNIALEVSSTDIKINLTNAPNIQGPLSVVTSTTTSNLNVSGTGAAEIVLFGTNALSGITNYVSLAAHKDTGSNLCLTLPTNGAAGSHSFMLWFTNKSGATNFQALLITNCSPGFVLSLDANCMPVWTTSNPYATNYVGNPNQFVFQGNTNISIIDGARMTNVILYGDSQAVAGSMVFGFVRFKTNASGGITVYDTDNSKTLATFTNAIADIGGDGRVTFSHAGALVAGSTTTGLEARGDMRIGTLYASNAVGIQITNKPLVLGSNSYVGWTGSVDPSTGAIDTSIMRGSAVRTVDVRSTNGNASLFYVYRSNEVNTVGAVLTDYERLKIGASSADFQVAVEKGGTGQNRNLDLLSLADLKMSPSSTLRWRFTSTQLKPEADNASDIGTASARVGSIYGSSNLFWTGNVNVGSTLNVSNNLATQRKTLTYTSTTNVVLDATNGVDFVLWMTTNSNVLVTNWPALPTSQDISLTLIQTNGGSLALTLINSNFKILTNASINVTAAAGANDVLSLKSGTNSTTAFAVIQKGFQ